MPDINPSPMRVLLRFIWGLALIALGVAVFYIHSGHSCADFYHYIPLGFAVVNIAFGYNHIEGALKDPTP